jgi:hypothetical protein
MESGDSVQVKRIWAHGQPAAWFGRYKFVRKDKEHYSFVTPTNSESLLFGMNIRYDNQDIRLNVNGNDCEFDLDT